MNRLSYRSMLLASVMGLGFAVSSDSALAQNTPADWHIVKVQNVTPLQMARWLDPVHNSRTVRTNAAPANNIRAFQLPDGVTSIVPIEAQNSLLVIGSSEGADTIEKLVASLDKPIAQVTITAQFVAISRENLRSLGLIVPESTENQTAASTVQAGFVRANYQAILTDLVNQNKATILSRVQLTALNNDPASYSFSTSTDNVFGYKDADGAFHALSEADEAVRTDAKPVSGARLVSEFNFAVTPTVNNDNTITLLLNPSRKLTLTNSGQAEPVPVTTLDSNSTIVNIKDGDTLALFGLSSRLFPSAGADLKKYKDTSVLLLVTARIVRLEKASHPG